MKTKEILLLVWLTALGLFRILPEATAQTVPCATPQQSQDSIIAREKLILQLKRQLTKNARVTQSMASQYLPIKAHILRRTDGTGGLSLANLNTALAQINLYFLNVGAGVQFYFCGSPDFIDNTALFDYDSSEESALCNTRDVSDAINIYFANTIQSGATQVSGYAYFPGTSSITNRIFLQVQFATDNRTLPHEMGHYFNLLHTFQNSTHANNNEREFVTRDPLQGANCTAKGDMLCDTPADPYGRDSANVAGCTYMGTARDPKGQLYAPSLSNIMSYYPILCGNTFTTGQYARMSDGILLRTNPSNQYNYGCGPTVTGANVPNNLAGIVNSSGLSLTFTDNSANESGFIIERSVTSASEGFVPIGGLPPNTTTFVDQTTTAFTTYHYRVKASNSSNQYSPVFTITTALNYCVPSYTNSCTTFPVIIADFGLKQGATTIFNNVNTGCSTNNYGDFTGTTYNVTAGTTYTLTGRAITQGSNSSFYDQHLTVWLDFDRDGVFELNERVYRSDSVSMTRMNPVASGAFIVPNTVSGLVRLRARSRVNLGPGSAVVNPCGQLDYGETEDYLLNVTSSAPSITTGSVVPGIVCAGQTVSVSFSVNNFSSTSYVVQLSDANGSNFADVATSGTGSPLTAAIPLGTITGAGYKVRVVSVSPSVIGTASSTFTINALPGPPTVMTPVNYTEGQASVPLSATGTNLKWYMVSSGGMASTTAPTPSTTSAGSTNYYVSQTVNNCESDLAVIQVNVTPPSTAAVCLNVALFLEGPYNGSQTMTTRLNQQGLLPGQTPTSPFGVATPPGQPYSIAPWNYAGSETVSSYAPNVVDWVLVSLRTSPQNPAATVFRTAALLLSDGTVSTLVACPVLGINQSYYVVAEHRNHMGVASHQAVSVINNTITYNFKTQQSYLPPGSPANGQKQIGVGTYGMYSTDCTKNVLPQIDANDISKWRVDNGRFGRYLVTDFNLDGASDANDNNLWRINNGRFSSINF